MITLKNVKTLNGNVTNQTIESHNTQIIDGQERLVLMPALIDTDALLGPLSGKGDMTWTQKAHAFLKAGFTTIFDASAQAASTIQQYQGTARDLLSSNHLPLHVACFYDGNMPDEFDAIGKFKSAAVSIKITIDMGKKPISPPHTSALDRLFQIAAQENKIVTISLMQGLGNVFDQRKTALATVETALSLAEKYSAELCLQHVRTKEEVVLIKHAKKNGILVYLEVAFQHLFLNDKLYPQGIAVNNANLFLPTPDDQEALWHALNDGTVDLLGSAGHFCPPALFLPLLLEAHSRKQVTLDKLIGTTRANAEAIFRQQPNQDIVLVDMETKKPLPADPLFPFWKDKSCAGWPVYVISNGEVVPC